MTRLTRFLRAVLIALGAACALQSAQAQAAYSQAELDQLLAPVALYPDAVLGQILEAATRPLEVVEAARWSRAHPGLQGDDALRAVQSEPWDPSVRALVAFPGLLARMDEDLEWTKALGDAFFTQEPMVMDTIQALRRRALQAGQLAPDERLNILDNGQTILIQPATPQLVYLPYYDPWLVYGTWWWPAYPPVAWRPWPGYVPRRHPGFAAGFWWGPTTGTSLRLIPGGIDWPRHRFRAAPRLGARPVPQAGTRPPHAAPTTRPERPRLEQRVEPQRRAPLRVRRSPDAAAAPRPPVRAASPSGARPAQPVIAPQPRAVRRPGTSPTPPRLQPEPSRPSASPAPTPRSAQREPRRPATAPARHTAPQRSTAVPAPLEPVREGPRGRSVQP